MTMNKKMSVAVLVLGCLSLLTACQPSNVVSKVKQHTVTVLNQKDQVWRETEAVSATVTSQGSLKNEQVKPDNKLSPAITNAGKFYSVATFKQSDYATIKKAIQKNEAQPKTLRFVTVKQVNATLKAMGATKQIKALTDLVYTQQADGHTFPSNDGYLIEGDHLYEVIMAYTTGGNASTVNRGNVYSRKIKYWTTKQLTFNVVAGTWQSTAGDQATVRDDQLVTIQNKSYVRGKVENLSHLQGEKLYRNTAYSLRQTQLVKQNAKLTQESLVAGDLYDNMYLFLSKTKMARVNTSGVTIFTKKADQSQIPAQVFEVFRLLDQRHTDEVAAYLLPHGTDTYSVALTRSINYATVNYEGGATGAESVSIQDGKISVGPDLNHN